MRVTRDLLSAAVLLGLASALAAQLPQTRLKSIVPASGQVGTTVELRLTSGDDLEEIASLHFTHPGITAAPKMQEADGQSRPVDNTFVVDIAGEVPAGVYEVRAAGLWGVSNPRRFAVSARPHVAENDDNNTPEKAQVLELNSSVVGQMNGGTDVDCYRFTAAKGQRVVIDCLAEQLDSLLKADLLLRDAAGRRLAAKKNAGGEDPTLVFDAPADGEYVVELHDQTFRSGAEYIYRLDVHTGPHIAFVMPPAGPAGAKSRFALHGYNLPGGTPVEAKLGRVALEKLDVEIEVPQPAAAPLLQNLVRSYEADVDAFSWSLETSAGRSNPVRIGISERPVVLETEPNDEPAQAQVVTAPAEVAGQLAQPGDRDWVAFTGKPGEVYWIEVIGQRTGTRLDPVLVVEEVTTGEDGAEQVKRLTQLDDNGTNVAQNVFDTFTDDPVYRLAIDKEATYRVAVYDRYGQTRGDPSLHYRLSIRGDEPDFRVVAVPAQKGTNTGISLPIGLRKGGAVGVDLYALRKFGHEGPIDVRVEGLPAGVRCAGTTIGTKENAGLLVFCADEDAPETVANVRLIAEAKIESPAAIRALEEANRRLTEAEKPVGGLRQKLDEARGKLMEGVKQRDEAGTQANADPENEALANTLKQKQDAVTALEQQFAQAEAALASGEKPVAEAREAIQQAKATLRQSTRNVQHLVVAGTLTSGGQNNVPATGRVSQSLALAVLREPAPFELRASPQRVVAAQSQQILVPVQLVKRNGFDDKVQLTIAGVPKNSNLQVANVAIEKGQSEALVSIFVKDNTPPGTYALWITSTGQVSYSRNPEKTARITAERDAVAEQLKAAQAAVQQATEAKNKATQSAAEAATKLQQSQQAKQQADQQVQQRTNELGQIKPQVEATAAKVEETNKAVTSAEAALKAAQAASGAEPENTDLQAQAAAAETALAEAQKQSQAAATAREELSKKQAEAERLLSEATTAQQQATEAVPTAEAAKKEADAAKTAAEAAEKKAQDEAKRTEDRKKAQDKRVEDAQKVSNPQNKNFTPPAPPIIFDVVPAPVKLTVSVPGNGEVKQGQSLEIGVKVERLNQFTGPVQLGLGLPPQMSGIGGESGIAADAIEGKLTLTATGDAKEGPVAHAVVRATVEHEGRLLSVDAPVTLKISK